MNTIDAAWGIAHLTDAAVRALIPAAAAALLLILFRVRKANLRLAVWTGVLYAALAMPLLGLLLPSIPVRVPEGFLAIVSPTHSNSIASGLARISRRKPGLDTKQVVLTDWRPNAPLRMDRAAIAAPAKPALADWRARVASLTAAEIALGIYLLASVWMLGRLALGALLAQRLCRRGRRIEDPKAWRWLKWHALAMGVDRPPRLVESAAITVPLTIGAWRPVILLPDGWREWESSKLSAVIAHELSHVSRNDSRTKTVALIYRSVFWFSPLSWWLQSHLAALGEQASDLAAIGAGAEPGYYAEVLMSFFKAIQNSGARVCRQGLAMARAGARFGGRGGAQERIEKILSSNGMPSGKPKAWLLALVALLAVPLLYLAAATRPVLVASPVVVAQWPGPPPPAAPAIAPVPPEAPPAPAARMTPVAKTMTVPPAAPYAVIAPSAPIPPPGWSQEPEPPEPPEPPQAEGDGQWTISNTYAGVAFAVVAPRSVIMNGSNDDVDAVRALRSKVGGDFIWFKHDGNPYVIRDAAIVKNAQGLYAGMDELDRQQDELGRQQDELGRKQDELGRQQDAVRVKVPADLEARLKKVEDDIRRLGSTASQDDLGRLQGELGDLQGYLGDLQGKAGDEQGKLGDKQGELGRQQGELGEKQGELGRRQGEIAREASRKMQGILQQALANGKAERVHM